MHVHRPVVDLGLSDLYAAQAAKKAAEAKAAADVRRKLMKASAGIDGESFELGAFYVYRRSGAGSQQGEDEEDAHHFGSSSAQTG